MRTLTSSMAMAAAALLALSLTALPAAAATATANLNIRSGPGVGYPVIGVIAANTPVTVTSCAPASAWCAVEAGGQQGWANSAYLTNPVAGQATYGSVAPLLVQPPADNASAQGHSYDVFPSQDSPNYGNPFGGKS
jgi:uncharacterized protein YraI